MNSLLRGMRSTLGGQDLAIKNSLISQLSTCVKDLQIEHADPDGNESGSTEAVSALCTILEAIFIHGLKDSFLQRMSQAIRSEFDARPDPNFWGPLLVVSHRDVIDQVSSLNLLQTDVGRGRAWLRLALNEGVLSRYLEAMRREGQRALSHYYRRGALLRDTELLDVVQRLLEGIESFPLDLPLNSSLLDTWTTEPLLQAGLWTPPMRSTARKEIVTVATDAASVLEREERESLAADTVSIASLASHHSAGVGSMLKLNEEEALKIILGTPVDETPISARQRAEETAAECRVAGKLDQKQAEPDMIQKEADMETSMTSQTSIQADANAEKEEDDTVSALGNSIIGRLGWSSSFEESVEKIEVQEDTIKVKRKAGPSRGKNRLQSYNALLESYNTASTSAMTPPDLNDFLQRFEPSSNSSPARSLSGQNDLSYPQDLGYEIVDNSPSSCYVPEFGSLLLQVTKLPHEYGLDSQKYTCFGCDQPIGFNFGTARLCGLSGRYYCDGCTVAPGDEWVVPARILLNWDFRRVSVSKRAATFLNEIQYHPLLDLKVLNPCLYLTVEEVAELQKLRNELNLLRAYLFTCREPIIEELQKLVWPREYLYEHIHLYSISDLLQIPTGILAQLLKQVVAFARNHVHKCWLCSQKGFFCEVCNSPNIIYPFDTDTTYRCGGCSAVFHANCLSKEKPCPKCERRRLREDVSLVDAAVES